MVEKPILIFDGDCGFCTSASNFCKTHSKTLIDIIPWQYARLSDYGLTEKQASSKVYFVDSTGSYAGHAAFARLLQLQASRFLKFVGHLIVLWPFSIVARVGYWLVARYRHKLPGGTPACKLPRE